MRFLALFVLILCSIGCRAGPAQPSFLANASEEAQKALGDFSKDPKATITQMKDELREWGAKYNLTDDVEQYLEVETTKMEDTHQNVTSMIGRLSLVEDQLMVIIRDDSLTLPQMAEAIERLREKYKLELDAVLFMAALLKNEAIGKIGNACEWMDPELQEGPICRAIGSSRNSN